MQEANYPHNLDSIFICASCETAILVIKTGVAVEPLMCCNEPMLTHQLISQEYIKMPEDQ